MTDAVTIPGVGGAVDAVTIPGVDGAVDAVTVLGVGCAAEFDNLAVGALPASTFLLGGAREFDNFALNQAIAGPAEDDAQFAAILGKACQGGIATLLARDDKQLRAIAISKGTGTHIRLKLELELENLN